MFIEPGNLQDGELQRDYFQPGYQLMSTSQLDAKGPTPVLKEEAAATGCQCAGNSAIASWR